MGRILMVSLAIFALLLMSGGTEASCPPGCKSCKKSGWCNSCKSGWLKKSGSCIKCSNYVDGCSSCKWWSGQVYCTKCYHGYSWKKGSCSPPCKKGWAGCQQCANGKCKKCQKARWDSMHDFWTCWGLTHKGTCTKCPPNGNHWEGYCYSCDGNNPSWCTKCFDMNGQAMYADHTGACQFCGEGCLKCANKTGNCKVCDSLNGWAKNGFGGCTQAPQ